MDIESQISLLISQKDAETKAKVIFDTRTISKLKEEMQIVYQKQLADSLYIFEDGIKSRLLECNYKFDGSSGNEFLTELNSDLMYNFLLTIASSYSNKVLN